MCVEYCRPSGCLGHVSSASLPSLTSSEVLLLWGMYSGLLQDVYAAHSLVVGEDGAGAIGQGLYLDRSYGFDREALCMQLKPPQG